MSNKPEYDRFAKQLWVKVYQDARSQKESRIIAKDIADLAMADYMNSIHGVILAVKKNFTTDIELENTRKERDNYYDRLQELRKDNADLGAENKRLKEQNENLDVAYMAGLIDGGKKQSATKNMIEVSFTLDEENDVEFDAGNSSTVNLCTKLNRMYIDQTRIKRIWLEMKSEDE